MNQLTLLNIILLLMGLALHVLLSVQKILKDPVKQFSIPRWVQENWINFAIALIAAGASLLMAEDLVKVLRLAPDSDSPFYSFHAFLSGYMGREMIFKALKVVGKLK